MLLISEQGQLTYMGCARFPEIFQNFSECQILQSLSSVDFLALKLKLPSLSVAPELPVYARSDDKCGKFSKTSTPHVMKLQIHVTIIDNKIVCLLRFPIKNPHEHRSCHFSPMVICIDMNHKRKCLQMNYMLFLDKCCTINNFSFNVKDVFVRYTSYSTLWSENNLEKYMTTLQRGSQKPNKA